MNLPEIVQNYLDQRQLPYRTITYPANETLAQVATRLELPIGRVMRVVLLRDQSGLIMAILPSSHILDFSLLCRALQRDLEPLHGAQTASFFQNQGCKAGSYPPLPQAFGVSALVDDSLLVADEDEIYFDGGSGDTLIGMRGVDFHSLLDEARWEHFAIPISDLDSLLNQQAITPKNLASISSRYTPMGLQEGIESITELPIMSQTTRQILLLRTYETISTRDILSIVSHDPSLAAQVMYWAHSPLYSHLDAIDSLQTAIDRVLGVDNTLNLLLGSSMSQTFRIPADGPAGLQAFWRHSIYCASLVNELVKLLPESMDIKPGLAYLGGLLHNFGCLVLGHVFPARFFLFNRFLAVNRHVPIKMVERYVLGAEHWQIGAWLMQAWSMPEEVIAAVRWHHHEDCTQPHAAYSNLVLIANRLLHHLGIGHEENDRLPALAMFTLGISRDQAMVALAHVQENAQALDSLSGALQLSSENQDGV